MGKIWVLVGKKPFILCANASAMTISNKKTRTNVIMGMAIAAALAALIPMIVLSNDTEAASMEKPYVKVFAKNALYEPAAGKTNVFGPGGIFPFFDATFSCADTITCGVAVEGSTFKGAFKEGSQKENKFWVEYTAPISYGDHQVKDHKYRIVLQDTNWNTDSLEQTPMPTRIPDFLVEGKGVAFDQIQHGHSMIDRADVPMFMNKVALYGHVNVYDITNGNKLVAENIFTHLMVGKVVDEKSYFTNMQANPATQTVVALFIVNIPSGVKLPGDIGPLTSEQAQSFTPLADDLSLANSPPVMYDQLESQGVMAKKPMPQSTVWPVDNPTQPVFFTFLLFTDVKTFDSTTGNIR
ncbi:MAG: hypothetical protein HZA82_05610 [Thaumarchaeota archaeon]|nr:hypothetical protein [Nitrososphaerota archaeon]